MRTRRAVVHSVRSGRVHDKIDKRGGKETRLPYTAIIPVLPDNGKINLPITSSERQRDKQSKKEFDYLSYNSRRRPNS